MATTYNSTTAAPIGATVTHRIVAALSGVAGKVRTWNDNRRTVNALRALSPAQLNDIGLTRADIENFGR
jgi:uncharacterized protein YjiS (DUF1127 family)